MAGDALAPEHLIGHVKDADHFVFPRLLVGGDGHVTLPQPFEMEQPVVFSVGVPAVDTMIEPLDGRLTKFMVLEVLGAAIIAVLFISLARKMSSGQQVKGRFWNLLETFVVFIRDEVARPSIGKHDADKFLPFLWSTFFFVLGCNLLGMVPWLGSPTGSISVTAALALITFLVVVGAGMARMGALGYLKAQVPHIDLPPLLAVFLIPMIFVIEIMGIFIKHSVLAVRLVANMMAGHLVLSVLVAFIGASWSSMAVWGVAPASIGGATALSMLELFVAFLQAYIFTFLAALFIGMSLHPH